MALLRRDAKRDKVEKALVAHLAAKGAVCWRVSIADFPDLIVRYRNLWVPVEVKSPVGKLTTGQRVFVDSARSVGAPVYVITTADDADNMLIELDKLWRTR